jgi:hypothetical protein
MIPLKIASGIITQFLSGSGDFLDITLGGTGAITAAAARTNLGLQIGLNVEAWSTELDGLAANTASTGIVTRTGTGTYTSRTMTAGGSGTMSITNGNGVSGNPTFELATVSQGSSGTSFVKVQLNSFGQVINNTAVTTADITTLVDATYVNVNGDTMTGFLTLNADPTSALHAATKQYVDSLAIGTGERGTAFYATTTTLPANTYNNGTAGVGATLTGNANGPLAAIDGQTPVVNDLILVKNEATTANNGFYKLTQLGVGGSTPYILTRATTADTPTKLSGMLVAVDLGTTNSGSLWLQTTTIVTVGTTSQTWTEINKAADLQAGTGITISGNTVSVTTNGITNALLRQGTGLSVIGVTGSSSANVADIVGTASTILAVNSGGTSLSFTTVATAMIGNSQVTYAKIQNETNATLLGNNSGGAAAPSEITVGTGLTFTSTTALGVATNGITNALFRQGIARSVVGVTGNATANVADIQGTADQVLVVNGAGTALAFGTVATAGITNSAITYAKIQNEGAGTILGNGTGSPAAPQEITPTARFALTSGSLDLATSGVSATTYGSGTLIPVITVDVYGRITLASTTALASMPVANAATTAALSPTNNYANGTAGVGATLTATGNGVLTVDGYSTVLNDFILVKNEASGLKNGLYQVTTQGTAGVPYVLTRVTAMDTTGEFSGQNIYVYGTGTVNANTLWQCTNIGNITVGTTAVTFVGLNKANDIIAGTAITFSGTANNTIGVTTNGITNALIRQGTGLSVIGVTGSSTANVADIVGSASTVLAVNSGGTSLSFTTVATAMIGNSQVTYAKIQNEAATSLLGNPTGSPAAPSEVTLASNLTFSGSTLTVATNGITNALFRQGAALSVVGVTGNATANVADIAGTASQVLRVNTGGTALAFGTVDTAGITASAVTYAKIQNEAASTLLGNPTGSPAAPSEITLGAGLSFSGTTLFSSQQTLMPVAVVATTTALPAGTYSNGASGVGATFTVTATGTLTIDGYLTALNDYILVKNQASGFQNGLYQVTTAGAVGVQAILTRATQMDTTGEYSGQNIYVYGTGTVNANTIWQCTNIGNITVGSTAVTFVGLNKANDIIAGTAITFSGTANNTIGVTTNGITNALIRQGAGLSIIGVTGSSTANVADIVGTASTVLSVNAGGTALTFTTISTAMIGASQVTYAKIQNEAAGTLLGNGTGSPAAPQEITPAARFALSSGALDLQSGVVTPGTYGSVTVDTYGRVTAGTSISSNVPTTFTATNGEAGSIVIGAPVYVSAANTVKKGINNSALANASCVGLVNDVSVSSAGTANIALNGVVTATTGQWDAVAGTTGGLTAGTRYFLGSTAGTLTATAPSTGFSTQVGMALSTTVMILMIQEPIQLS